ncbi:MAG: choice-of-anchor D domain-containing protein [Paludibacter sp.]|nr:choice-of-anchor D domain-containing protein [Paludibacter sp.]
MRKLSITFILLYYLTISHAGNIVKVNQYQSLPDAELIIEIEVENDDPFVAFQADIPIPEGFKYINNSAALNPDRVSGHALSASLLTGNVLRLIGYSTNNVAFTGNSGSLVSFTLKAGKSPGTFPLQINQATLANSLSENILTGTVNGSITVLAPDIQLSATGLNFSRVALGTKAESGFNILNTGNQDLIISSLSFDDPQFSTIETTNIIIAGSSGRYIPVRFAPVTKGNYAKSLYINSNDPDQPSFKVALEAVAFAVNELHTGSISGASSTDCTLEFNVNNMEAFTGIQFDINLPHAMSYIPGSATLFRRDDHIIAVNALNASTLRILAYSPGNKNFSLNDGKLMELGFHLNGTGGYYQIDISNVIISDSSGENILSASYGGSLQITSSDISTSNQLAFGDVSMTSEKELSQIIYNYGQEPLIINQLTFSNEFFSSPQSLPVTIQPYQQLNLPVVFKKTEKGQTSGTMKIFSNDPDESIYSVELTGNAFAPNYLKIITERIIQGETKDIEIAIDNEESFVAFQFDLKYPEGLTPDIGGIRLSDRKQDHIVTANLLTNNTIRIISYSPEQQSFTSKSGKVVSIPFTCDVNMLTGSYNIEFMNAFLSNEKSGNILYSAVNGMIDTGPATKLLFPSLQSWHIYPNPSTGKIHVQINEEDITNGTLSIFDIVGKIILQQDISGEKTIQVDLSGRQPGIYFLKINEMTKKIILK